MIGLGPDWDRIGIGLGPAGGNLAPARVDKSKPRVKLHDNLVTIRFLSAILAIFDLLDADRFEERTCFRLRPAYLTR